MEDLIKIMDDLSATFFQKNNKKLFTEGKLEKGNNNAINGHLPYRYTSCYSNLLKDKIQIIENQQINLYTFTKTSNLFSSSFLNKKKHKLHIKLSIKSITTIKDQVTQFTYKA